MTQLRGALVGAGSVTPFHLQAWARIPQATIVAIADLNLETARTRAREFDVDRVYPSLADLLRSEVGLDFLDIAAPPEAHLELVELAAEHGLHVNCQKPFAPSLAEARAMIKICQDAGVLLNINENWRWRPWFRTIRHMISEGKIGRPVYARFFSHSSSWLPGRARLTRDHRFFGWERVILYDWGIHHIDVLRFLFGEPSSVYAQMTSINPELNGEERAVVVLAFGNLTALLDLSWSSYAAWGYTGRLGRHMVEDVRIEGDQGTIVLLPDRDRGDLMRLTTADQEWERPAYDCEPMEAYQRSYVEAQRHFVECLRSGAEPETNARDNYETLAITLAAYHSAKHNEVVRVTDFKRMS